MSSSTVYIALGTNIGDLNANLDTAIGQLRRHVTIERVSAIYETEPAYVTDQARFYNMVLRGCTTLTPEALLNFLKEIEATMGREKTMRYGPRLIDLDILIYNEQQIETDELVIPHPRMTERAFVMIPLAEIAPQLILPRQQQPVQSLAQALQEQGQGKIVQILDLLPNTLQIGSHRFEWGSQTYVMGIINVTVDSFSGDGLIDTAKGQEAWVQAAVAQGERFVQAGAHVLDVGGESTRPGADAIDAATELARVVPVIEALAQAVDCPISVDTYKAQVAEAALDAGATMVNDVWGLRRDPNLATLCAERSVPIVVMHNRSEPHQVAQEAMLGGRYVGTDYDDLLRDIMQELQISIDLAKAASIPDTHIIIDPGIGFGKTVAQNLTLLNNLDTLKQLGYPILLGTSNKSLIGYTLGLPPEDRIEGTSATIAIGIDRGADIVRVHQVEAMSRVAKMTDAIVRQSDRIVG